MYFHRLGLWENCWLALLTLPEHKQDVLFTQSLSKNWPELAHPVASSGCLNGASRQLTSQLGMHLRADAALTCPPFFQTARWRFPALSLCNSRQSISEPKDPRIDVSALDKISSRRTLKLWKLEMVGQKRKHPGKTFFLPFQTYIYFKLAPLIRRVWCPIEAIHGSNNNCSPNWKGCQRAYKFDRSCAKGLCALVP